MSEMPTLLLDEALTEVEARFIVTLPKQEIKQSERLFFHIEQAYWFYEDFFADKHNNLPHYKTLKQFTEVLIAHCPQLRHLTGKMAALFESFCDYKASIPVCGCIMLNAAMSRMVLVRNWKGTSWSFPRGKINQNESPFDCAMRETYEETGFNPRAHCKEENVLTLREKQGKSAKMYIAIGVPENTEFDPQTRKEISKVQFHDISGLPKSNWGILPFMQMLDKWIEKNTTFDKGSKKKGKKEKKTAAEAASFDRRNQSTFGDIASGQDTWGVEDMFSTNARLTGQQYVYDGNPHNFGNVHPRYVNYNQTTTVTLSDQVEEKVLDQTVVIETASSTIISTGMEEKTATTADVAAQRDIAKISAILRYLALPGVDMGSPQSIQYDELLKSISKQRKMVRKVKEAGGVNITSNRMGKIVENAVGGGSSANSSEDQAGHAESLTDSGLLDSASLIRGVDSYLDMHYDSIVW